MPHPNRPQQHGLTTLTCVCLLSCLGRFSACLLGQAPLEATASEFDLASLPHEPAALIDAPVVSGCPLVMECKWLKTVQVPKRKPDSEPDGRLLRDLRR